MKTFKELRESLKDSCWKGYEAIGTKKKNGKTVPNCVPVKEEETSWYPKKGFPKEGEYGYHPNPGLKPQESDRDKDMDVAYKIANDKEGRKLPNAKILEVPNKIEKTKATAPVKESYEEAQKHLDKASKALETSDMHAHHQHMSDHFEELGKWHESKGRSDSAQKAYDKAEEHHEASLKPDRKTLKPQYKIKEEVKQIKKGPFADPKVRDKWQKTPGSTSDFVKKRAAAMRKLPFKDSVKEEVEQLDERGEDSKGYYRSTESGAGLTRKGAKAMGIKTAVTTPPSKLDPNGKAAKRRKSFCARMSGMKGPMKDEKGRPTRKAMSLRRWNCN